MTTIAQAPAPKASKGIPMTSLRKATALVAGIFYLITFISIPTLAIYGPVKNHADFILGSGSHARRAARRPARGDRRPGRHRHRRHAVPGGQAAERRLRAGLCRRPRPGSRHHLHRRLQPALPG